MDRIRISKILPIFNASSNHNTPTSETSLDIEYYGGYESDIDESEADSEDEDDNDYDAESLDSLFEETANDTNFVQNITYLLSSRD